MFVLMVDAGVGGIYDEGTGPRLARRGGCAEC